MAYSVKIDGNNMLVYYAGEAQRLASFRIGDGLLDFLYQEKTEFEEEFTRLINIAKFAKATDFSQVLAKLKSENIYIIYFISLYFEYILPDGSLKKGFDEFRKRFATESEYVLKEEKNANTHPSSLISNCIKKTILLHAEGMKSYVKKHLEFCINEEGVYGTLNKLQKFYLYEKWAEKNGQTPIYWENNPFISVLGNAVNFEVAKEDIASAADRMRFQNANVYETYALNSGWALIRFELIKLMEQNPIVKTCSNCNKYFVPEGRVDSEYCTRIIKDDPSKTCALVGAMKKYKSKISDNPAYSIYTKTYKRLNSRVRAGKLTKSEFTEWSKKARKKRDNCVSDKLSLEEFEKWLNTF